MNVSQGFGGSRQRHAITGNGNVAQVASIAQTRLGRKIILGVGHVIMGSDQCNYQHVVWNENQFLITGSAVDMYCIQLVRLDAALPRRL